MCEWVDSVLVSLVGLRTVCVRCLCVCVCAREFMHIFCKFMREYIKSYTHQCRHATYTQANACAHTHTLSHTHDFCCIYASYVHGICECERKTKIAKNSVCQRKLSWYIMNSINTCDRTVGKAHHAVASSSRMLMASLWMLMATPLSSCPQCWAWCQYALWSAAAHSWCGQNRHPRIASQASLPRI